MTDNERKLQALTKLAVRRQATQLEPSTYVVYLEDLQQTPLEVVELACETVGKAPRAEYETAYPPVGNLLQACKRAAVELQEARWKAIAATAPKSLPPAEEMPPSREEASRVMAGFRARVRQLMRGETA